MCFSAGASFTAGIALLAVGIATVHKTSQPSYQLFAAIPLIFGIQQIAEGILWLSLPDPALEGVQRIAMSIFLFFAEILWPVWVPLSLLIIEKNKRRRKILLLLLGSGLAVGIYLAFCLVNYRVEAEISGHHIAYLQDYPSFLRGYGILLYVLATVVPPFFSSVRRMSFFGILILLSYAVTALYFSRYMVSVWCFFAAVLSFYTYYIILEIPDREKQMAGEPMK